MSRSERPPNDVGPEPTTTTRDEAPKLWVELDVDVASGAHCPLGSDDRTDWNGSVQLVGSTCHLTLVSDSDTASETRTVTSAITDRCLCTGLCGDGVAPAELTVERGSLVIGAYVTDRKTLSEATDRLEDGVDRWRLRQLTTTASADTVPGAANRQDDVTLTEKQREAVQTAVDRGYYDRPRDASLGDLADELGVTRSALSQRLNAVESKLITDLSETL
ncbi:MAG: helix-turn-helix domain-containing protein [Halanaeroarchaeum sp.]